MNSLISNLYLFASDISVIAREKLSGPGIHYGVMLSNGIVIHSTNDKGPHYVTYEEFAAGKSVQEIRKVPMSECQATMQRIQQELSRPASYHLLENNCETFANRVTGGAPESKQVKDWAIFFAVIGLIAVAAKA